MSSTAAASAGAAWFLGGLDLPRVGELRPSTELLAELSSGTMSDASKRVTIGPNLKNKAPSTMRMSRAEWVLPLGSVM